MLGQRIERGGCYETEVARQGEFKAHTKAVATGSGHDRLAAAGGCCNVPCELAHVLGRGLEEALDVAAAGEVLSFRAKDDDAHAVVGIQRFKCDAQLLSLGHGDHIERGSAQNDVSAFTRWVYLHAVAVQGGAQRERRMVEVIELHDFLCDWLRRV